MAFVAPLLLALLLLLSLGLSRRPLAGRTWLLLRSLFPSWRFFEDVEPGPQLSFRALQLGREPGPWQPALGAPPRPGFLLSAPGNLHLARQSLVEQLWSELDGVTVEGASGLTSYRLVQRLVVERMRELGLASPGARYQFRLTTSKAPAEVDFESDEHAS